MNSNSNRKGYRAAFSSTALFGGVQIITIIVTVLRTKIIAVLIGPAGFGLMGLFNSTISLISSLSNLGLSNSAVREIAQIHEIGNTLKISTKIAAIRKCIFVTGVLGFCLTIILSPCLSEWTFGGNQYISSFILLSIIVFFTAITGANNAVIQGCRKLKLLAQSTIYSSLLGLLICIPIFLFIKENSVVVFLTLMSLCSLLCSYYYYLKTKNKESFIKIGLSLKQAFKEGEGVIKLGLMMAVSAIFVSLTEFVVKFFITHSGGLEDVGLYQAGWAINTSYLGLVFTAMATDYYPRLSSLSKDNQKVSECVNQQAEIALLILGPLIIGMLIFLKFLISILYTDQFLEIEMMTKWLLIGSLVKAGSWAVSYIFLAKGAGKLYLTNEIGIKFITLPSYLLGYISGGLEGIGLAYISNYTIYYIWVSIVAYKQYHFKNSISIWKILGLLLLFSAFFQLSSFLINNFLLKMLVNILIFVIVLCYCVYELNKRIQLKDIFNNMKSRFCKRL